MRRLTGHATARGFALAPAVLVRSTRPPADAATRVAAGSPAEERERLDDALTRAAAQLKELADRVTVGIGHDEGDIFAAHAAFAADPELAARARTAIEAGVPADRAISEAFASFRGLLQASDSTYLAARAADLDDVRDRVLALLAGTTVDIEPPDEPSVIVAYELSPSQTVLIPRSRIAALVTESGSRTSHAAILARSLGVPAVVGVRGIVDAVADGVLVAVDGLSGEVIVEPDQAQRERFQQQTTAETERRAELAALRDEPAITADGRRVEVAANIGSDDDLRLAVDAGAEGTGLVRTELLYLDRGQAPDVEEQAAFVERVLRSFPGARVVVRTLDVGADKPLPFVPRPEEENPALGRRGIRLSLAEPALFRDQLRALLLARSAVSGEGGRLAIMFPLVSLPSELSEARRHLEEVARELHHDLAGVEVGVMVETPAAALATARLCEQADFVSIGTNDLLQYLFAADRLNAEVAELADPADPLVLRLLAEVVDAAHAGGAWVGVCGEAASDPATAVALVGLSVDELSMTAAAIPEIKSALRRLTWSDCRDAARSAQLQPDAAAARDVLTRALSA